MGLGKTIQMISFIDIFLNYTDNKSVLLILPINTLQNWLAEFNMWTPSAAALGDNYMGITPRTYEVYILNDSHKTTNSRAKLIGKFLKCTKYH